MLFLAFEQIANADLSLKKTVKCHHHLFFQSLWCTLQINSAPNVSFYVTNNTMIKKAEETS